MRFTRRVHSSSKRRRFVSRWNKRWPRATTSRNPTIRDSLANVNFQNIFLLLLASRIHQAEIEERLDLAEKYTKRRQDAIVLSKRRPLIIPVDAVEET